MRTIPLQIVNIESYTASSLAHNFNRRLQHIGEPLVNVTIEVDSYSVDRDFATMTYDYLTIKTGHHWNMVVTFRNDNHDKVSISLRRLVSDAGVYNRMQVTEQDPNRILNEDYLKSQLLFDDMQTIEKNNGWEVITSVMQAYAAALVSRASNMTAHFVLPDRGDANVSLITAGRTPSSMNQYFTVAYHRNVDGFLAVHTSNRFYGAKMSDDIDNILYFKHYSNSVSTQVVNSWLPLSWFVKDIYFQVNAISKLQYNTNEDLLSMYQVPQLYGEDMLQVRNYSGIESALKRTYLHRDVLKSFFGYEFERCSITGKFYAKPGADPDFYETLYSISDLQTPRPVSVYALRRVVGKLLIDEECDDCSTYTHVGHIEFYNAVQDRYAHVFGRLAEFVQDRYGSYAMDNLTNDQTTVAIYRELLHIADAEYPDYAPDYYCSSCDRGEDYYEEEDDHNHRSEYLGATDINKLQNIAEANGKQIYIKEGFPFFITDEAEFTTDFQWRNYHNYEVNDYSHRPAMTFINGDCMEKTKLYMGVEWEMDNGGEIHRKALAINSALSGNQPYSWTMSDGSLQNGIEIATMPATLEAHTNVFNWSLACDTAVALGYRAHDTSTAGMHVHINRNFFSDDKKLQLYRGSLMALVMERNWDDFVKFSRRRYNRLDQWAKKKHLADNLHPDITTDGMVDRVNKEYGNGDKYLAINLRNPNTFELRIFRGTLKADSIKATLQFVSNLANWCKHNTLAKAQTATIEDIINYKEYPELKAYWEENKNREVNN